jgi:hypothetical protein
MARATKSCMLARHHEVKGAFGSDYLIICTGSRLSQINPNISNSMAVPRLKIATPTFGTSAPIAVCPLQMIACVLSWRRMQSAISARITLAFISLRLKADRAARSARKASDRVAGHRTA